MAPGGTTTRSDAPDREVIMGNIQFFQTRTGQRFYESTMPEMVRQIARLNDLLERIAAKHGAANLL